MKNRKIEQQLRRRIQELELQVKVLAVENKQAHAWIDGLQQALHVVARGVRRG